MRTLFAVVAAVLVGASLVSPAAATQRSPISIHTLGGLDAEFHQFGTFEASGAFTDTGTFAFQEDVRTLFHFGANGADNFGIAHSIEFFASDAGTFQFENTVKFVFEDGFASVTGNWTVLRGTGDYSRLRGQGTIVGTIGGDPEVFDFTFTGQVDLT